MAAKGTPVGLGRSTEGILLMVHGLISPATCGNVGSQTRRESVIMAPAAQSVAERSQTRLEPNSPTPGADYRTFCLAPVEKAQLAHSTRGKMCVINSGLASRACPGASRGFWLMVHGLISPATCGNVGSQTWRFLARMAPTDGHPTSRTKSPEGSFDVIGTTKAPSPR